MSLHKKPHVRSLGKKHRYKPVGYFPPKVVIERKLREDIRAGKVVPPEPAVVPAKEVTKPSLQSAISKDRHHTLGQIAYEAAVLQADLVGPWPPWDQVGIDVRFAWANIASAVAIEVQKILAEPK